MDRRILVVDENEHCRSQIANRLAAPGRVIDVASDATSALEALLDASYSLVITSDALEGLSGLVLLHEIKARDIPVTGLLTAALPSVETIVEAMRLGAYEVVEKPIDLDRLEIVVANALSERMVQDELQALRSGLSQRYSFANLLGRSANMRAIFDRVARVAASRCNVLITGETGTGKELVAQAIHHNDRTRRGRLVVVNCAAIPESLIESELFGHEKGAFTNADRRRIGRFEQAQGGTLLLDEIGSLPPTMQAKLLRVLQDGTFERLGGEEMLRTDARVIAATNENLSQAVQDGRFREDLFYRLNVVAIELPPLRDRIEDLPLLASHFLTRLQERGFPERTLSRDALSVLMSYEWPGNVRELEHVIEQMAVTSSTSVIGPDSVPPQVVPSRDEPFSLAYDPERPLPDIIEAVNEQLERAYLLQILRKYNGRIDPCARHCGLSRRSISEKLRRYGIDKTEFKPHLARRRQASISGSSAHIG